MIFITEINAEAAKYLQNTNPTLWATSMFPVPRIGCITSNSAESMYSWINESRNGSHLNFLVNWISKVAGMFYKRNSLYRKISTTFPESTQHKLNENIQEG